MALIDLIPPSIEPVDLAYAKTFLRVDGTDEDALIASLIGMAREQVETMIGRTLIQRSYLYRTASVRQTCFIIPKACWH